MQQHFEKRFFVIFRLALIYSYGFDFWYGLHYKELRDKQGENDNALLKAASSFDDDWNDLEKGQDEYEKYYNSKKYLKLGEKLVLPTEKSPLCEMPRSKNDWVGIITENNSTPLSRMGCYNILNELIARGVFDEGEVTEDYLKRRGENIKKSAKLYKLNPEKAIEEVVRLKRVYDEESKRTGTSNKIDDDEAAIFTELTKLLLTKSALAKRKDIPESARQVLRK